MTPSDFNYDGELDLLIQSLTADGLVNLTLFQSVDRARYGLYTAHAQRPSRFHVLTAGFSVDSKLLCVGGRSSARDGWKQ